MDVGMGRMNGRMEWKKGWNRKRDEIELLLANWLFDLTNRWDLENLSFYTV